MRRLLVIPEGDERTSSGENKLGIWFLPRTRFPPDRTKRRGAPLRSGGNCVCSLAWSKRTKKTFAPNPNPETDTAGSAGRVQRRSIQLACAVGFQ